MTDRNEYFRLVETICKKCGRKERDTKKAPMPGMEKKVIDDKLCYKCQLNSHIEERLPISPAPKYFSPIKRKFEAIQWTGDNFEIIRDFLGMKPKTDKRYGKLKIPNLDIPREIGHGHVWYGDFIFKDKNGYFVHMPYEDFVKNYELEEDR